MYVILSAHVILSSHVILSEAKDLSAIRILRRYAPQNDKLVSS